MPRVLHYVGKLASVAFNQLFHENVESTANTGALLESIEFLGSRPLNRKGPLQSLLMRHIDLRIYESWPRQSREGTSGQFTGS